jgi:hypothetical protein
MLGVLSMYWTDLRSMSMFYGGILPLIDIFFLVYLTVGIIKLFAPRGSGLDPSSAVDMSSTVYSSNGDDSSCVSSVNGAARGDASDCGGGGE